MSSSDPAGSQPRLEIDLDQARRFLAALTGDANQILVFQLFADRKKLVLRRDEWVVPIQRFIPKSSFPAMR